MQKKVALILSLTLLAVFISAFISKYILTPVYEARSLLMVLQADDSKQIGRKMEQLDLEDVISLASKMPDYTMQSYVTQIKSDGVLQRVINKLGLTDNNPSSLQGMISASLIKDTNLIEVRVDHSDPVLAANIANTLDSEFVNFITETNLEKLTKSGALLEQQTNEEEKNYQNAVSTLNNFLIQPRNPDLLSKDIQNISDLLLEYEKNKMLAEVEVEELNGLINELNNRIENTSPMISIKDGTKERTIDNSDYYSLLRQLRQKQYELEGKKAKLLTIENAIAALRARWESVQEELTVKQMEHDRLKGNVDRLDKTRNVLHQKLTDIRIAKSVNQGETTVKFASPASTPTAPIKPNLSFNVTIGLILGFTISVVIAFSVELLDKTIKSKMDILRKLKIPYLGSVPYCYKTKSRDKKQNIIWYPRREYKNVSYDDVSPDMLEIPNSPVIELYRAICTGMRYQALDKDKKVILCTSTEPKEGNSNITANMAVTFAQTGLRTLLIDGDLRRPVQHKFFGINNHYGLSNILLNNLPFQKVLTPSSYPGLDIMTSGPLPPNPPELLSGQYIKNMLNEIVDRYDVVLIDSPPIVSVTDSIILAGLAHGTVLNVRTRYCHIDTVKEAIYRIHQGKGKIIGAILIGVEGNKKHVHYQRLQRESD
ncbi:polysaccharide biosynthesis tyrosine autokinase [Heliobacterium chlorum]|uniref:non-specific protein-tyrosine kinase n=1 Tax=Heliobacterium chlorum TaxID=2698 RepID=A0ABR7T2Q6_HELCL|nr:polysaccharide biosynthesis tyrosine autokinase [Heliobacterium chlorum]